MSEQALPRRCRDVASVADHPVRPGREDHILDTGLERLPRLAVGVCGWWVGFWVGGVLVGVLEYESR